MQLKRVYFLEILAQKVLSCLLKSHHGASWCFCHRGPTWRLFLRSLLPEDVLVTGFNFPCLQRPLCILLLRPACQEDFCSNVSRAHPHCHMHTRVRMLVCAHSYGQRAEKRAVLAVEKILGTIRTQPENYSLTYESWILKVLIHLRMETLASPDLHIETYMTSFSDRLFFSPCLLKLAKWMIPLLILQVSKCSFLLYAMSLENIQRV